MEAVGQTHGVPLDVLHADPEQVIEGRAQLVDRFKGQGRVPILSGVVMQPVAVPAKRLRHVEVPEAIGDHEIEEFFPDIKGGHAMPGKQPLVGSRGEEVDADLFHVQIQAPDPLDCVGVQVGALGVGQLGEGREVVAVAVLVGDPGHGDHPGASVDAIRERVHRHASIKGGHDANLDSPGFGEVLVEDVGGLEVKIVDHDVVAGAEVERPGHDVFPVAGGIEQSDLRFASADEPGELLPHGVGLLHHGSQAQGAAGLRVEKCPDGFHRRDR